MPAPHDDPAAQVACTVATYSYAPDPTTGQPVRTVTDVQVLAQSTAHPLLVIHPLIGPDRRFRDGFQLTHLPTGIAVTQGDPDLLDRIASRAGGLPWDQLQWADDTHRELTGRTPELLEGAAAAIRAAQLTPNSPQDFTAPADQVWDGTRQTLPTVGAVQDATTLLRLALSDFQHAWDQMHGPNHVPLEVDGPDGKPTTNSTWLFWCERMASNYGVVFLLAVLRRLDPTVADSAARSLDQAWAAGDSLGEWAYQWHQEELTGEHLTLPGIPAADITTQLAIAE